MNVVVVKQGLNVLGSENSFGSKHTSMLKSAEKSNQRDLHVDSWSCTHALIGWII